jgi:hypothetical protein
MTSLVRELITSSSSPVYKPNKPYSLADSQLLLCPTSAHIRACDVTRHATCLHMFQLFVSIISGPETFRPELATRKIEVSKELTRYH